MLQVQLQSKNEPLIATSQQLYKNVWPALLGLTYISPYPLMEQLVAQHKLFHANVQVIYTLPTVIDDPYRLKCGLCSGKFAIIYEPSTVVPNVQQTGSGSGGIIGGYNQY
ncbi:MAG: hypothetical protein EZS28_050021 [Streblomastix strix]|uniref:Uncharacterized protein n=1 Tax=Streblomastix strix TaxID=222440 RepID=A0A5J4T910_9EUKA|nr:MAG: hypothetical protein EZS28_050021 [Streblomastix strix]